MHYKAKFNRERPSQVCPALLPPIPVPGHASYPSGHATQAHLMALCVADVVRNAVLDANLKALAARIAKIERSLVCTIQATLTPGRFWQKKPSIGCSNARLAIIARQIEVRTRNGCCPQRMEMEMIMQGADVDAHGLPGAARAGENIAPAACTDLDSEVGHKFDPATATDMELERLKLPPRPDPRTCPLSYEHWVRGLSQPLCVIEPELAFDANRDRRLSDTSLNWSGAYIRPRVSRKFTRIQGMWVVPRPYPPQIQDRWVKGRRYHSSTWIGLDGFDLSSLSLPQLGTGQNVTVKSRTELDIKTYAWCQWWVRGLDGQRGPQIITNLKVRPGDLMYCEITVLGPKRVVGNIKNRPHRGLCRLHVR